MFVLHHCVFLFTLIWTSVKAEAKVKETIHSELETRTAKAFNLSFSKILLYLVERATFFLVTVFQCNILTFRQHNLSQGALDTHQLTIYSTEQSVRR